MESNNTNYRTINIVIAVLGVAACIGGCFISAPAGLLADESTDLLHMLMPDDILTLFAVPALLVVLSAIIVMIGRAGILAVATAIAGGALFAWMDIDFAMSNRGCTGTLVNAIGIVLVVTAALLQAFGTPTVRQLKSELSVAASEEHEERSREARIFFDDAADAAPVSFVNTADDDGGIDINELRYEALRIESKDMPAEDISGQASGETEEWSTSNDLEALLRSEINELEEETAQSEPSESIEEMIDSISLGDDFFSADETAEEETAADETAAEEAAADEIANMTDFYGGLEELFLDE